MDTILRTSAVVIEEPSAHDRTLGGYVLQERLGEGGYGTVWRGIGPGGLAKAVKVLRGNFDGPAADAELKALQRMRELRHPFVLSIERIEVIDGRLIIVTELAECSLEKRFETLLKEGRRGIPREELLGYMRDAADALDYMCEQHGLQHLDIKPGNLLIQGGHVKIADFGMIKDVQNAQHSLVSGFTPLYAPPELFEGNACRFSDQYSLAMVYQTLLTGMPPFNGRTPAQLASQHLSSPPDLSSLPQSDRPAVSRALAKNPNARFRNCREFVDYLTRHRTESARPAAATSAGPGNTETVRSRSNPTSETKHAEPTPSRPAAPIALTAPAYRPTIVVGLGGLATSVLLDYRRRLGARFEGVGPIPTLPLLAIDTDARSLAAVRATRDADGLRDRETLSLPLRDAKEYRGASAQILEWLSRRWLYNIPRSRQVDGMRPLGRLAFIDHAAAIRGRLHELIGEACAPSSVAAAAKQTGLAFQGKPEIVLVGASHGGTGSGTLLDAAYLTRAVLKELRLEGNIVGVMLHGTSARDRGRDVQVASTVACLQEWSHYVRHGFPSDRSGRTADSEQPPFDQAYLVHLGDQLSEVAFEHGALRVAEYLYRTAVTPARAWVDALRRTPEGEARAAQVLRTFDLHSISAAERPELAARELCDSLVRQWQEGPLSADETSVTAPTASAATLLAELRLEPEALIGMAASVARSDVGKAFEAFVEQRVAQLGETVSDAAAWQRSLHADFQSPPAEAPAGHPGRILNAIAGQSRTWGQQCADSLLARLSVLASSSSGETEAPAVLREILKGLQSLIDTVEQTATGGLTALDAAKAAPPKGGREAAFLVQNAYRQFFAAGLLACLAETLRGLAQAVEGFATDLVTLRPRLSQLESALSSDLEPAAADAESAGASPAGGPPSSLVAGFAASLQAGNRLTLRHLARVPAESLTDWASQLREAAVQYLIEQGVSDTGDVATKPDVAGPSPVLADVGGQHRVLAIGRGEPARAAGATTSSHDRRLRGVFGDCITPLRDPNESPCDICEIEGIDVQSAIARLTNASERLLQVAEQFHTRHDIEWTRP